MYVCVGGIGQRWSKRSRIPELCSASNNSKKWVENMSIYFFIQLVVCGGLGMWSYVLPHQPPPNKNRSKWTLCVA